MFAGLSDQPELLKFANRSQPSPPIEQASAAEDQSLKGRGRILVVEDEFLVAAIAEEILMDAGYAVVVACTAVDAIEAAVAQHPDLILMDISLGAGPTGIEAAKEILKRTGRRCIFATAHADQNTRAAAAVAEPLAWLQKPYSDRELLRAVREVLKTRR